MAVITSQAVEQAEACVAEVSAAEVRQAVKVVRPLSWAKFVRLTFAPGELVVSVTDGVRTVAEFTISADCAGWGTFTTTIPQLSAVVKAVKGQDRVSFDCGEVLVVRRDGCATATIPSATSVPHWPTPELPTGEGFTLPGDLLGEVVKAASTDDARPILTAVCIDGGHITATDSYRLHRVTLPTTLSADPVLIPGKVVQAAVACKGPVRMVIGHVEQNGAGRVLVEADRLRIVADLIPGSFPNVEQVIPKGDAPPVLRFERAEMGAAVVDLAAVAKSMRKADDATKALRVEQLTTGLRLYVVGHDGAAAEAHVASGSTDGQPGFVLAANAAFLADLLDGLESGAVGYFDELRPLVVRESLDTFTRTRLLMPVRVAH